MLEDIGLSDFFELTPDLVWLAGKDGFLKKVNPAVSRKLGYSVEELLGKPVTTFMHPADVEITLQKRFKLLQGEVLHNFCNRYISKSGAVIWLEWTSVYLFDREIVLAIAKDITDRKKIEQEVEEQHSKFKGLASHFKTLLENDRKYFAYELHEELAQLLAVINMDISWLNSQEAGFPDNVKDRISHASEVCRLMIQTIQRLAFSISPQMLDDLGLNATMEWLCTEFSVLHGIECSFEHHYDEHALTYEMKMDFFRISQETLSDILDHSQAGKITVSIKDVTHGIELMIHDNGYGFATDIAKQSNGLMSIRERAKSINGTIILQNDYMRGTSVSLLIEKQYSPVVTGFL